MAQPKRARSRIIATQRRARALELRLSGATEFFIAAELGVSQPAVSKMLKKALEPTKKLIEERGDELRALELERIDTLMMSLWSRAIGRTVEGQVIEAEPSVTDRIVRLMSRRAELLGLDAPKRTELSGRDGEPISTENRVVFYPDNGRLDDQGKSPEKKEAKEA